MLSALSNFLTPTKNGSEANGAPGSPVSTSAGSSGRPEVVDSPAAPDQGLPDYEYPGLVVKNTFIDGTCNGPTSLDGFLQDRRIQSSPGGIAAPPGLGLDMKTNPQMIEEAIAEAKAEWEAKNSATPAGDDETPTATPSRPMQWPRTMSGEALLELAGAADEATTSTPEEPPMVVQEATSPARATQPTQWPRTMSGEALDLVLAGLPEGSSSDARDTSADAAQNAAPASPCRPTLWPRTMSGDALESALSPATDLTPQKENSMDASNFAPATPVPPPPPDWAPVIQPQALPPPPSASAEAPGAVLRLADALPEPTLGSPEMPTVGSRTHRIGTCKPCAFLHTKGCNNGEQCSFCHLCEPGEKKRRQREKRLQQQINTSNRAVAAATVATAGLPAPAWPAMADGAYDPSVLGMPQFDQSMLQEQGAAAR